MNSLRQRLLVGLLTGLGLLWVGAGGGTYLTVRHSLERAFDTELKAMAAAVRYLLPEGRHLQPPEPSAFWFDFFQPASGLYFEAWDEFQLFSDRSASLGERHLPRPAEFAQTPRFGNATLPPDENVRLLVQQFTLAPPAAPGEPPAGQDYILNVVVARNRQALDRSLQLLLAATGLAGLLLVPFSFAIATLAVSHGLRPLRSFANRAQAFDMDSLHERFATAGVPAELLPVSQRLNELLERLAAGIERERRLNADLAHELRTPVAELKTMAEVALAWPDKLQANPFQEVLGVANQMQALIDNMLLLARWERSPERPPAEPIDIRDMLAQCWQSHAPAAGAKGLQFVTSVPDGTMLTTNPDLFRIILSNLFANAVEYSPQGGTVDVAAGWANRNFSLAVTNPVTDLATDDIPRLFDRFWRCDPARSRSTHAGLGLALAKTCADILQLHLAAQLDDPPRRISFRLSN